MPEESLAGQRQWPYDIPRPRAEGRCSPLGAQDRRWRHHRCAAGGVHGLGAVHRREHAGNVAPDERVRALWQGSQGSDPAPGGGQTVRLERDVEQYDRYGRLLAYVDVGDTMVNAELVRQGYARVATFPPNVKDQELCLGRQREARKASGGCGRTNPAGWSRQPRARAW